MDGYMMDDEEASPSESEGMDREHKSDETEDKLALVPMSFFKEHPKPGKRETVEVVEVYENEVSIKCVYGEGKKEEKSEEESESEPEAEDEMMA